MQRAFELEVVTPEGVLFRGSVSGLRLPGVDGDLGILCGHARMIVALRCGITRVRHVDGIGEEVATGDGHADVSSDRTRLIVEFVNLRSDIEQGRAHGALARALERLSLREEGLDLIRAEAALCRALTRLRLCGCGCELCETASVRL